MVSDQNEAGVSRFRIGHPMVLGFLRCLDESENSVAIKRVDHKADVVRS